MKTTLLTVFLGAALAMGCGGKKDDAKPTAVSSDDDYMKQAQALSDKMLQTFKDNAKDCDKLAGELEKIHTDAAPLEEYEKTHADAKKKFDDMMKAKEKDMMDAVMPVMTGCKDNKKLVDVMSKFK